MTKPDDQNAKELLRMLTEELNGSPETPPPGFLRRLEWEKAWGCSDGQAKKLLDAGMRAGIIEMRRFRVRCAHGVVSVPHYRHVSGLKKAK